MLLLSVLWAVLVGLEGVWGRDLTDEERRIIVEKHNRLRAAVDPSATNMKSMSYGQDLEEIAAQYATKCIWDHNPALKDIGENLYLRNSSLDVGMAMDKWFLEHQDYTYDTGHCQPGKMCGHYTQLVWANSSRVGCGAHYCSEVQGLDFSGTMLVCNYSPKGNYIGEKPYEEGESCSSCPAQHHCLDNLCVPDKPETTTPEWTTTADWKESPQGDTDSPPSTGMTQDDSGTPSSSDQPEEDGQTPASSEEPFTSSQQLPEGAEDRWERGEAGRPVSHWTLCLLLTLLLGLVMT
ncbi:peptidase inhibitor 16 [Amia ocellicauda]|uniref:peptidase inhibitor 16 n=1 Tax=Amia ocellicauda TaxID=2972642 RepID=UPI0034645E16